MLLREIRVTTALLDNTTLRTSYGANVTRREHLFVSVRADDGQQGIGEGSPLPHFSGERASEMLAVIRDVLAPPLLGRDPFDLEGAWRALERAIPRHHASKAALVSALIDLQGRICGLAAHQLLGGKLKDRLPLAGAVGIEAPEQVVQKVHQLIGQGIRTVKLKVGADLARDLRVLHELREVFGMDIELRADANAGFTFPEAHRFLRDVEGLHLQYLEQPLPPRDLAGLAELRRLGTTPIAVDESLFGLDDALAILRHGAADVFIIKLIKLGGLHEARKVVALAEAARMRCVVVSPYETTVGVAANIHLAVASSTFPYASELGVGVSQVRLPGVGELLYANGEVRVPTAPGLGVEIPPDLFRDAVRVGGAVPS